MDMAMTEARTEAAPARTVATPPAPEPPAPEPPAETPKRPASDRIPSIIVAVVMLRLAGVSPNSDAMRIMISDCRFAIAR